MTDRKRFLFIDFLRFSAIYLMFWDHGLKLFYNFNEKALFGKWLAGLAGKILSLTSLSSALFLFLAGFCLAISFNQQKEKNNLVWFSKKLKRAAILTFLSYLLFFFKFNLEKTGVITSSGILQLIGVSSVLGSLFLFLPKKMRIFWIIFANCLILVFNFALRAKAIKINFLNSGIFPLLPHFSYVLTGLAIGEKYSYWQKRKMEKKFLKNLILGSVIGTVVFLSAAHFNPYLFFASRYLTGGFWQPSIDLIVFNSFLITSILATLAFVEKKLTSIPLFRQAGLIGQEALNIYFFHVLLGWGIAKYILKGTAFGIWASLLAVTAFLWLGVNWIKFRKIKENYFDQTL